MSPKAQPPPDRTSHATPAVSADEAVAELATVRDWLRFAVSRFNAAALVYGHGTDNALDESAFLILTALKLPIDALDPWLDARLTRPERHRLAGLIDARVTTRKPAPYLVGEAFIAGRRFAIDERVIIPRSFIGELLVRDPTVLAPESDAVRRVLDLCTGSGCLAILAAEAFPDATIDAVDMSADALDVARRNVADYALNERIELVSSDLFDGLAGRRYDLILSNPPYVTSAAVAAFPPEYRAEPRLAHDGGSDGLDLVRRILADARRHLTGNGTLLVEVGQTADALEALYPEIGFVWLDTEQSAREVFLLPAAAVPASDSSDRPPRRRTRRLARA